MFGVQLPSCYGRGQVRLNDGDTAATFDVVSDPMPGPTMHTYFEVKWSIFVNTTRSPLILFLHWVYLNNSISTIPSRCLTLRYIHGHDG